MARIISVVLAALIGVVTTSFGYGWTNADGFFFPGACLNLFLVILETIIVRKALDEK